MVEGAEWVLPDVLDERARFGPSILHCVDNMEHQHTTAHLVTTIARQLGLEDHLQVRLPYGRPVPCFPEKLILKQSALFGPVSTLGAYEA